LFDPLFAINSVIVEYYGPGLATLSAMDRHVIANMGAELGPAYDVHDEIDHASLKPLIAMLSSPGNARPVSEVAGERIYQAYIGMGQAPATHELSLRTVPRSFLGRSGTREDKVCLVSPETATASALTGVITDPRTLGQTSRPTIDERNC